MEPVNDQWQNEILISPGDRFQICPLKNLMEPEKSSYKSLPEQETKPNQTECSYNYYEFGTGREIVKILR